MFLRNAIIAALTHTAVIAALTAIVFLTSCFARNIPAGAVPANAAQDDNFGQPATAQEIARWNIDVRPDGTGLPPGSGTPEHGQDVYETNCLACHGTNGQGGIGGRLAGGQGSLASANPVKTIGSFWPYATTLFDYIHRAMPYPKPGSLSPDDTYAVEAYLLHLNGLWPSGKRLDQTNLPQIKMPNRNGFVIDPEFSKLPNI